MLMDEFHCQEFHDVSLSKKSKLYKIFPWKEYKHKKLFLQEFHLKKWMNVDG